MPPPTYRDTLDVHESSREFSISGQVMLSMPGKPCMRCMGLVTDEAIAKEAARFGAAGGKPQVVWPNGTLASIAVGFFMKLVTPWETRKATPLLLEYDADLQTEAPSNKLVYQPAYCKHFDSLNELGDPFGLPMLSQLSNRYTRMESFIGTGGRRFNLP